MTKNTSSRARVALTAVALGMFNVASGCAGSDGQESLGTQQQAVYDFDENQGIFLPAALGDPLRENIVVSIWKQGKWAQAGATNVGDGCSGTLIAPRVVLTSASCIRRLGNVTQADVYVGTRTPDVPGGSVKFESESIRPVVTPATQPNFMGRDLAIIYLKQAVIEQAIVHRPAFTAPAPLTPKDANGWAPYAAGISGWSPYTIVSGTVIPEPQTTRQTFYKTTAGDDELRLNRTTTRPLWWATTIKPVSNLPKVGLAPGDNGGPLFRKGANGQLEVIGVASILGAPADPLAPPSYSWSAVPANFQTECATPPEAQGYVPDAPYQCNVWTDVTNSTLATAIANLARDNTRTTRWKASHPRVGEGQSSTPWLGEVDYGGPCDAVKDPDCDHTYAWNTDGSPRDNCPGISNVDQLDTLDLGMGDACLASCAAQACTEANSCASLKAPAPPRCSVASAISTSASGSYGNSSCSSLYSTVIDSSLVADGRPMSVGVEWGDAALTATTCPNAKLELTVFRQVQGGALTTTAHRYHGVWSASFPVGCSFTLDTGYSHPASITRSATETVKLSASARLQSGGASTYKRVSVFVQTGTGPC